MDSMEQNIQDEIKAALLEAYNAGAADAQQSIVNSIRDVADIFSKANMKTEWRIYTEMADSIALVRLATDGPK